MTVERFKHYRANKDRPSARDLNRRGDAIYGLSMSASNDCFIDSTGVHTLNRRETRLIIKIFEVQSNATGDGIYNCREEKVINANWNLQDGSVKTTEKDTTNYEVLNLNEHNPDAEQHNLSVGDFLVGWQTIDDACKKWVGIKPSGETHKAYCKDDAGAATTIDCYLNVDDTGQEITVNCSIAGGGNLDSALPRLADGTLIFVEKINGDWYCKTVFQASENCACS